MKASSYPFSAIVGQPNLKLALLLSSVDWRLSVLLKGDKGSGKSTAARALADILPAGAPFVNLPIGTSEDRLLGGLDLSQALQGQTTMKHGLIHQAHRGVLYIDEINLLADSLTDALLDVASSGHQYIERDGFSASIDAQFVLLGSMNSEEGALRPQLLDRFALALEVEAPWMAEERAQIVESRLQFDSDPDEFCAAYQAEQDRLRSAIVEARALASSLQPSREILEAISQAVNDAGVRSLRADLGTLRAAISHAALHRRTDITADDVQTVLPLVLEHRARRRPPQPPRPPEPPSLQTEQQARGGGAAGERVFPPEPIQAPDLRAEPRSAMARGQKISQDQTTLNTSPGSNGSANKESLDAVASLTQSFRNAGVASLRQEHLVFRTSQPKAGMRFIFVIDASGSHAAHQRMRAVKGAAAALLDSSVDRKDEVAVISFRGAKAEIVLEPCRDAEAALRALEFLPTGGRTPLAHALQLAQTLVTPASTLILLTDGRANVPLRSSDPRNSDPRNSDPRNSDPWQDALEIARELHCPSVLVSSAVNANDPQTSALAEALGSRLIHLDEFTSESLASLPRP